MGDRLGTQGAVGILPSFFDINRYMEGKYAYIHTFCDINRLWTWTWAFGLHFVRYQSSMDMGMASRLG